jgi:DNA-binding transcriptional ArsR family regulator
MKHQIDLHQVKKAQMALRALNHKLRQKILSTIEKEGNITVTELYVKLRLEQAVASQHLGILRKANIVITKREGRFIYYSVNFERIAQIEKYVGELNK